ncbi:hypothetical protein RJT34_07308 [Clitoria ternatea]|uniref:Uncharacterized protein n=1 Tax=Clitoria ternatea TaxID=43366 RepID=A0AAN9K2I4_CLITE
MLLVATQLKPKFLTFLASVPLKLKDPQREEETTPPDRKTTETSQQILTLFQLSTFNSHDLDFKASPIP